MTAPQPLPFGALLKRLRRAKDLTQEKLAEQAGYSPIYVSMLERGARRPLASTVALLAEALELEPAERAALEAARRGRRRANQRPPSSDGGGSGPPGGRRSREGAPPPLAPIPAPTPTLPAPSVEEPSASAAAPPAARRHLPAGTVTFLVTDVEPAMPVVQRLGPAAAALLADHQRLLRAAFAAHHGHEVETQGSRFLVAFPVAADAVAAAAQAQRALARQAWPTGTALQVRMGLHSGAPALVGDHYLGLDVHRAERIAAAGHGGQVLLSEGTRVLAERELPAGASLRDLGPHRLTDLQRPEHLYQLCLDDLPAAFPPLTSLDAHPHNLPVQPTPLLGREREVAAVTALLRREGGRLVTITGPGGTGKTRLSLQVAAELVDTFPDGVWFVRLARLTDPELVLPTMAATLDLQEGGGESITVVLRAFLRDKSLLLLLDNFEQVADAAPPVAELLSACPGVRVLVTSRVPLHLRGEQEYPLTPLPLPDLAHLPPPERLSQYAAVALFIERAQAVLPDFTVTNASAPAVAEICARLDGLPLAIELAANHVKLLPPPALLQRLERRLPLLVGGARDLDARQQTMWATLAWSEGLLAPAERRLFRRLSVFVGGCTLEAAEAVCAAPEGAETLGLDVLAGLGRLVDASMVQQRTERGEDGEGEEGGEVRVGMLHVIREYAQDQLEASGEAEALRRGHAAFFLALAERAEPELVGPQAAVWLERLGREQDNLRATMQWVLEPAQTQRDPELALRLGHALTEFWSVRGLYREGQAFLEQALTANQDGATVLRARVLTSAAHYTSLLGDVERAETLCQESLALSRTLGDTRGIISGLALLAYIARDNGGHYQLARSLVEESLARARELGEKEIIAWRLAELADHFCVLGEYHEGQRLFDESLALFRELGNKRGLAHCLRTSAAYLIFDDGDPTTIHDRLEETLTLCTESGDKIGLGLYSLYAGYAALVEGDPVTARVLVEQSLALSREIGSRWDSIFAIAILARIAARQEDYAAALVSPPGEPEGSGCV